MKKAKLGTKIKFLSKRAMQFANDNAPAIMTGAGMVGSALAVLLAGKAGIKAHYILEEKHEKEAEQGIEMKKHEQIFSDVTAVAKVWAPTVVVEGAALACIFGSYKVNAKRLAALATAAGLSQKQLEEFKNKAKEMIGEEKVQEIDHEITKDAVVQHKLQDNDELDDYVKQMIMDGTMVRFYDRSTDTFFISTRAKILETQADINNNLRNGCEQYYNLNEVRQWFGLKPMELCKKVYYTADYPLDINFGMGDIDSNGVPYREITFNITGSDPYYS